MLIFIKGSNPFFEPAPAAARRGKQVAFRWARNSTDDRRPIALRSSA